MKKNRISLAMILRGSMYLLSLNLLVFLRRQFGERVADDLCVACGFSWCCSKLYCAVRIRFFPQLPEPRLTPFFLYVLSGLAALHLVCIWLRGNKPVTIHSYSRGRPMDLWRVFRIRDEGLVRYVQPSVCAVVALGLDLWDRALACWIGAASVAVFVEEQLERIHTRRRVLDTIDGRIEAQTLYGQVQERITPVPARVAHATVIETEKPSSRATEKLETIMERLDPELRKMLELGESSKPEKEK